MVRVHVEPGAKPEDNHVIVRFHDVRNHLNYDDAVSHMVFDDQIDEIEEGIHSMACCVMLFMLVVILYLVLLNWMGKH